MLLHINKKSRSALIIRARHGRITHCLCHLWFTDGFDTRDLNEAKALLEELASYYPSAETPAKMAGTKTHCMGKLMAPTDFDGSTSK